jgi:phosphate-selective porin OprO/OprP
MQLQRQIAITIFLSILSLSLITRGQDAGAPDESSPSDQNQTITRAEMRAELQKIFSEMLLSRTLETAEEKQLRTIYDDGFYLTGKDDQLKIGGWAQADFRGFESGHPGNTEFLTRRARLDFRGVLEHDFAFRVYAGFAGASAKLTEAWLEYRKYPARRLRVGQFKVPFSLEASYSARWIRFVERAMGPTNLAPFEDIGVQVFGASQNKKLEYAVGVFNGRGKNASDVNDDMDIAARLVLQPWRGGGNPWVKGLYFGASATAGEADESLAGRSYRTAPRTNFLTFEPGVTHDGLRIRGGVEMEWLAGPLGLSGEYLMSRREDVSLGAAQQTVDSRSWYLSTTYMLTGEKQRRSKTIVPIKTFDPGKGGWGAWELSARYEEFETNDEALALGLFAGTDRVQAVTGGVSWWPNKHTKVRFEVVHSWFDDPVSVSGDLRDEETAYLARFQFNF